VLLILADLCGDASAKGWRALFVVYLFVFFWLVKYVVFVGLLMVCRGILWLFSWLLWLLVLIHLLELMVHVGCW